MNEGENSHLGDPLQKGEGHRRGSTLVSVMDPLPSVTYLDQHSPSVAEFEKVSLRPRRDLRRKGPLVPVPPSVARPVTGGSRLRVYSPRSARGVLCRRCGVLHFFP